MAFFPRLISLESVIYLVNKLRLFHVGTPGHQLLFEA
jgi:hypothetical protein